MKIDSYGDVIVLYFKENDEKTIIVKDRIIVELVSKEIMEI